MLTFSLVGNNNVHSFSFESLSNLTCELKYGEQAGSLFEEINASKSSPSFDGCLCSGFVAKSLLVAQIPLCKLFCTHS